MKTIYTLVALFMGTSMFAQLNMTYRGNITYDQELSDIWGYAAPDGSEYAIVGVYNGVSIVEVTDPENPTDLFFFPGANSIWRDIKTWGNFAYVTNETSQGVMVIDMTDLPSNASAYNWTPNIPGVGTISSCHNIWIDELGFAYLVGCNVNSGGMIYVDVSSSPGVPTVAGIGPAIYSHDVFVRNNISYCSEIYAGVFSIYNVSDKNNTQVLGSRETEGNFTHNAWLSSDSNILYTTDEVANAPVGSYNVSDPTDVQELDQFRPIQTLGEGVIPHNVHVWDDWLIISYYTDGCILVDGSNPTNLVEVGNFDTFIPASTGFDGAWGAYPYLPSGLVLISDIGNGMYVLEPNYVRACWLEGNVTDASTSFGIVGASLVLESTNVTESSGSQGSYATGYATAGTYNVTVSKSGYVPQTISVNLVNDVITELDVELVPLEVVTINGSVINTIDAAGISGAQIYITDGEYEVTVFADGSGNFNFPNLFQGTFQLTVGAWGYHGECTEIVLDENITGLELNLDPGYADDFSLDLGWTNTSTAVTGAWERAIPVGTSYFNNASNPGVDIAGDCAGFAYVTGNAGGDAGTDDVDDGSVTLDSPEFFANPALNPVVSYYRWFANYDNTVANDLLRIYLVNGGTQILLEEMNSSVQQGQWVYSEVNLVDFISTSGMYKLRIQTADDVGNGSIVEAGLDDFRVDNLTSLTERNLPMIQAFPNPSDNEFRLSLERITSTLNMKLMVLDVTGRTVIEQNLNANTKRLNIGEGLASGSYMIRIMDLNGKDLSSPLKVVKN